jgi:hypothetical protein
MKEATDVRRCIKLVQVMGIGMVVIGCSTPAPPPPPEAPKPVIHHEEIDTGPTVESAIGALSDYDVKKKFEQLLPNMTQCFSAGNQKVAYLAGDINFEVRIATDGKAMWAYVKDSTLGHRATETCMLGVLKAASWPRPKGGPGRAENSYTFDSGDGTRPPVAWTTKDLGKKGEKKVFKELEECRKQAGTKSLTATFYVETNGTAASVGVSSGDEKGEDAADCVISALKPLKFPSPGSYASKITISVPR